MEQRTEQAIGEEIADEVKRVNKRSIERRLAPKIEMPRLNRAQVSSSRPEIRLSSPAERSSNEPPKGPTIDPF